MGVVGHRRAGMADEKHASFGLRDLDEGVFGVVSSDALGKVLIGFVEF